MQKERENNLQNGLVRSILNLEIMRYHTRHKIGHQAQRLHERIPIIIIKLQSENDHLDVKSFMTKTVRRLENPIYLQCERRGRPRKQSRKQRHQLKQHLDLLSLELEASPTNSVTADFFKKYIFFKISFPIYPKSTLFRKLSETILIAVT